MEEYYFKSKIQPSDGVISNVKKQQEGEDGVLQTNNKQLVQLQTTIDGLTDTAQSLNQTARVLCEKQKQMQTTIDGLTKREEANNRTVQELLEKKKQMQNTIDGLTKTEEANNRTVQELLEKKKQMQTTIDGLTKTVESLNQTVQMLCRKPNDVSTCKVEAVTASKWTEIPPAINIVKVPPHNVVS